MQKLPLRMVSFTALTLLMASCASISKEECMAGNWEQVGYRDASGGYDSSRLGSEMEACGKIGVKIDKDQYNKGYQDGLKSYCTYEKGLQLGKSSSYYREICPPELANEFRRGYELGQQIGRIQTQINSIQGEVDQLEDQLSKEPLAYERRRIASDISSKRALIATLEVQITLLQSNMVHRL